MEPIQIKDTQYFVSQVAEDRKIIDKYIQDILNNPNTEFKKTNVNYPKIDMDEIMLKYKNKQYPCNKLRFFQFLSRKSFKNIFDITTSELNEAKEYKFLKIPTHVYNNCKNVYIEGNADKFRTLNIFTKSEFIDIMELYKFLQAYNTIGCCSWLIFAPLFISFRELKEFIQINEPGKNRYYAYKANSLVNIAIYNIIEKIVQRMKEVLSPELYNYILPKARMLYDCDQNWHISALNLKTLAAIFGELGLGLKIFATCRDLDKSKGTIYDSEKYTKYPKYCVIANFSKNKDTPHHIELQHKYGSLLFERDYIIDSKIADELYPDVDFALDYYNKEMNPNRQPDKGEEEMINNILEYEKHVDEMDFSMNTNRINRINRRINRMNRRMVNMLGVRNLPNRNNNQNNVKRVNNRNINNRNVIRNLNKIRRNNNNNRLNRINRNLNKKLNNVIKIQNPKTINMNISRNEKNMIITGKDIILSQDFNLNDNGFFACIPINPAYWDNTRIKNLAILNQYYIPISIKIEYVPLVSKFQKGNITIGTLSNSTMNQNNIQSTLISSTSGITYSCSNSFVREIQVKSLIPQKKLLINSKLDKESVPFYICVYFNNIKDNGENILPGQFYINYMFKFFNPVTSPGTFKSEQNIQIKNYDKSFLNISCLLMESNNNCKIGNIIDIEYRNDNYVFLLNGTEVDIDEEKLATFFYSDKYEDNQPRPDPPEPEPTPKIDLDITSYDDSGSGTTFTMENGFDILIDIPYSYDYIELTYVRAGVSSLSATVSQSYYTLKKSTDYETGLPAPLDEVVCNVLLITAQANYTKIRISTQNINIIN